MKGEERIAARRTHCPRSRRAGAWRGNPYRPFCSLSCRLIDLGVWLDEQYRIPGPRLSNESTAVDSQPHDRE